MMCRPLGKVVVPIVQSEYVNNVWKNTTNRRHLGFLRRRPRDGHGAETSYDGTRISGASPCSVLYDWLECCWLDVDGLR